MINVKKPRNLIIIAGIILVMVVGGSVVAIMWSNYQTSHNSAKKSSNTSNSSTLTPQQVAQKTADNAEKLSNSGNLQGSVQELNNAIKNTNDTSQQFIYYSQLADLLLNNNQLSSALDASKKAYQISQTSDSAALVGQIADQMGDKQTAIQYYTYAISHIDPNDMYAQSDKTYYQGIITGLQGGK